MLPKVNSPIQNYGDLKKAVQLWADRDDDEFVDQIPNFINFAEKEIYREIRVPYTAKEAYLKIDEGQAVVPADWLSTEYMLAAKGYKKFRETSSEEVLAKLEKHPNDVTAKEVIWCRLNNRFFFFPAITANQPTVDQYGLQLTDGSEVIIGYYADQMEMSGDQDQSTLLTVAPDLLLYTALIYAANFVKDADAEQQFKDKADAAAEALNDQNKKQDFKGSVKVIAPVNINQYW
ncbi:phage adaptor protein [Klebsiella variicola]|uniref:phage adaptor protein n=1 Tax=Klebsiella variicola TaxID=244366 RepID=UPI0034E028F7